MSLTSSPYTDKKLPFFKPKLKPIFFSIELHPCFPMGSGFVTVVEKKPSQLMRPYIPAQLLCLDPVWFMAHGMSVLLWWSEGSHALLFLFLALLTLLLLVCWQRQTAFGLLGGNSMEHFWLEFWLEKRPEIPF